MKHKTVVFVIFLVAVLSAAAQNVRVVSNEALTSKTDGYFCCPQMDKPGNQLFFTGSGYRGLYQYDLMTGKMSRITDAPGAGYEPALTEDGSGVVYRTYRLKDGRRFYSIINSNMRTNEKTVLQSERRALSVPRVFRNGTIAYTLHSQIEKDTRFASRKNEKDAQEQTAVFIENQKIALFVNGEKRFLKPRGEGSYIWPELSPSGKRLLFKKLGDGCYISDLDGQILSYLGNINAPHWSPDGKHIVYMADIDDGQQITASEIHIINADGSHDVQLTATEDKIELYPRWGNDSNTIIYNTEKGQIYLMRLEWK